MSEATPKVQSDEKQVIDLAKKIIGDEKRGPQKRRP